MARKKGKAPFFSRKAAPPKYPKPEIQSRFQVVDLARGFAILLMFIYHFIFDLNEFGAVNYNFNYDLFWLSFRAVIVSLFLGIMGISLHLATTGGFKPYSFFRRLGQLILYAGIVTFITYQLYPNNLVFFGILHFIALASIMGLTFTRFYYLNLVLGLLIIALGVFYQHPLFDRPSLWWFGLMTFKPPTLDYVPVIPWFGVVLLGLFAGQFIFGRQNKASSPATRWQSSRPTGRLMAWGGRHSLNIYMLHQPVFMGLLWVFFKIFPLAD